MGLPVLNRNQYRDAIQIQFSSTFKDSEHGEAGLHLIVEWEVPARPEMADEIGNRDGGGSRLESCRG